MRTRRIVSVTLLLALFASSVALAFTPAELLDRALVLVEKHDALEVRVQAQAEPASVLLAELGALDQQRFRLKADRATLPVPCDCSSLDAAIATIDVSAETMRTIVGGWEESN